MKFDHVRTRFAPSPTGYMHVGNLRTALYAYLTAKSMGGKMILRIEDTDQERQVEGAVDIIYNTMRDTGLLWDEGPDIGGPVGPYVQSERMGIYKEYALKLVELGAAYYCFCDKERLEEVRELQKASGIAPQYDRHCRNLTPEEVQAKLDQVRQDLREAALRISESVNQRVEELNRDVQEKLQAVQNVFDNVSGGLTALGDKLGRYQDAIQSTGTTLGGAIQLSATLRGDLGKLSDDVERIVTSDGFRRFLDVLENNPEELAGYLSDPIAMETVPVYEITTYGSAMAPYYIMLALFVGSLLTATMIHVNAPIPPLPLLRPWQRFFGRYQLFFLVGMVQALVTGLGCVYYIGMQCLHPGLFLLACCVCSLNFTMMNFALVYALDNIGMALSVIIMVIQVAGSGGSYPIDVLPEVFQKLYVLMPFHYGMDMLRETIAGRYENVYWTNLAVMAGMCVLFAALGMLLYYPARPLNRLIARSKEKSGIM